jgi:two-component system NtrC family sensor kinase
MVLVPNAGLPGITMIEVLAVLLLLVLFWLLAKGSSARFLRIWMAGWAVYAVFAASQVMSSWQAEPANKMLALELSFSAAVLFFAAVLDYLEQRKHIRWLWRLAAIVSIGLLVVSGQLHRPISAQWAITIMESCLLLAGGWFLWRSPRRQRGHGVMLLAAVGNQLSTEIDRSLLYRETRQAYENLRRTQEQLLQSEKMAAVGQLISGVVHELNNPLTAIIGYSQLLSSSEHVSARGGDYLQKLYKQALRTHRIVQNLLSFARQQKPERSPVQVNQIIEDTLVLREYDLKLNNITVHREFDADLPLTSGDSHQLQQVFLNMLNNAVDAVLEPSDRGDIWVRTGLQDGRLLIEFSDSGPGVKDSLRVFDPFYTTKPVGKGTGLGLSICYGIIKEHGGEIQVRNSPPRGAAFSVLLPLLRVESQADDPHQASDEKLGLGIVLLVDDEESVLELEQEILRGICREIHVVRSGREAILALKSHAIDVVITGIKMPGEISGADIYEWIEQHRPELAFRVVFTMSNLREEEARTLLERSGCRAVQKPFHIEEFLNTIRSALAADPQHPIKR